MPVIVWGETGCSFNGLVFEAFLTEIASHGIIIFANGSPTGGDNPNGIVETSNPDGSQLKSSIDFITNVAGTGKYAQVDASRIAAAGQSCGGVQAYTQYDDPRVTAIGIFNSGFIDATNATPSKITKPIFYFLGGSTDIAYTNVRPFLDSECLYPS
jgi:dienelactone hydrolase